MVLRRGQEHRDGGFMMDCAGHTLSHVLDLFLLISYFKEINTSAITVIQGKVERCRTDEV